MNRKADAIGSGSNCGSTRGIGDDSRFNSQCLQTVGKEQTSRRTIRLGRRWLSVWNEKTGDDRDFSRVTGEVHCRSSELSGPQTRRGGMLSFLVFGRAQAASSGVAVNESLELVKQRGVLSG